jgi:hypothetical protein
MSSFSEPPSPVPLLSPPPPLTPSAAVSLKRRRSSSGFQPLIGDAFDNMTAFGGKLVKILV